MHASTISAAGSDPSPDGPPAPPTLVCELCGQVHRALPLAPRERAVCVRCGRTLATGHRLGPSAALALTVTALLLAVPAAVLPLVTVGKLGHTHTGTLLTSVDALWQADLRVIAILILVCGSIAPLVLLGVLVGLLLPTRRAQPPRVLRALKRIVASLANWAMPEVQILAILVAFTKLGRLVDVQIGPGLWCYAGLSVATLFAWRSFDLTTPNLRGTRTAR